MVGNLGDLLRVAAERHPDREFVVCDDRRFTYETFNARVNGVCGALVDGGIGPGDHVASMGHNSDGLLALHFAVAKLGGVSVPLNTMLNGTEVAEVLERSDARIFVRDDDFAHIADGIRIADLERAPTNEEPPPAPGGDTAATVLYTSGSTGRPKGCTKSHANQIASAVNCQLETPRRADDTELFTVPLAGVGFANFVLPNVLVGSRVVLTRFDARRCLELIERERVTHVFLAGTMLSAMLECPGQQEHDLSSLRLVETAYQLSDRLRSAIAERFGPIVRYCYGSSEGSNWAAPADVFLSRPDCVGFPKGLDRYRIAAPDGEVGEVLVAGPTVMLGYLDDPEATGEALIDGWLHTGDLGLRDTDGMLLFRGRKKDMIKSGGLNVAAGEVEQALARHDAVAEVAVIGVPHDRWGEAVRAVVVLRGVRESDAVLAELRDHCRAHLAGYKRPKDILVTDALPKNPGGKIAKAEVRERFGAPA